MPKRPSRSDWCYIDFSRLETAEENRAARELVVLSRAATRGQKIVGDVRYVPHVREFRSGPNLYVRHESLYDSEHRITVYWCGATVFDSKIDRTDTCRFAEIFGRWEEALTLLREQCLLDALVFDEGPPEDR